MKRTIKIISTSIGFFFIASSGTNKPQVQGFKTVEIGAQTWMAENLNTNAFRNGDPIPQAITNEEWDKAAKERKPAWSYYDNNPENEKKYGKLYNWYALNDPRGLAPAGWHVPNDKEWKILKEFLGEMSGVKMKSTSGWNNEGNGTNSSGFSGLPGGQRGGSFISLGSQGFWWSTDVDFTGDAYSSTLSWVADYLYLSNSYAPGNGLSVRCVKD